jgi:hypothetical protein
MTRTHAAAPPKHKGRHRIPVPGHTGPDEIHEANPPVIKWLSAPERIKNGVDPSSVEGAVDLPYSIPNILSTTILWSSASP